MELRVLNYFLTVAREENFTRAAEQLHVTQPTLSRQIADLEAELGVKLFKRGSHNIMLTDDGMLLKRRAQEIVSLAERTKQDFLCKEENIEGTVSIGSGEFLSTRLLTDCIAAFRKKYPLVRYELYSGNADSIKESIERGLLDMARQAEIDVRFLPCTRKHINCQIRRHLFRRLNLVCSWEQVCQHHALLYNTRSENVSRLPSPQPCPYIQVTGPRRHIPVNGAMHSTFSQR